MHPYVSQLFSDEFCENVLITFINKDEGSIRRAFIKQGSRR